MQSSVKIVKMADIFWYNFKIYQKTIFLFVWPLALLPIFILPGYNTTDMRCFYVVILMAGYWVFEVIPLAVTALIPLVLFPLMGILDSKKTSIAYFKESNMMFMGSLIIALAVEFCGLHTRLSLMCMKMIGCSYRRLSFGLVILTMLISMWISNTVATAMMVPIIEEVLTELDGQGVGKMWEDQEESEGEIDPTTRRPTRVTMCFFLSTAYSASVGGIGCIVGSRTNMVTKEIYESIFPSQVLTFVEWFLVNAPLMLAVMYPTWIWLQFWFMGLFRPKSKDARAIDLGREGEKIVQQILTEKLKEMGPLTFHEVLVAIMFVLVALLWFLRSPGFMKGWHLLLTETQVGDVTAAMIVVVLLFMLPSTYDFVYIFSKDKEKRPKKPSQPLVTWRYVQQKMNWSLFLLIGGGFALAEGIQTSGLEKLIEDQFTSLSNLPRFSVVFVSCLMTIVITQITTSTAIANILLPIAANLSKKIQVHPMYLMMPVSLCCSFSYVLPVSTPPNAIVAAPCNMPTSEMIKAASVVEIIAFVMLMAIFPQIGRLIWDFDTFPDWARDIPVNNTNKT